MTTPKIRILLADDHALVRDGIRRVLEEDPEFLVVAEAADGERAVALGGDIVASTVTISTGDQKDR